MNDTTQGNRMPNKTVLSSARLKDLLRYDAESGSFVWLKNRGKAAAGATAGYFRPNGYVEVRIDGKGYLAHRLAWLYVTGDWPADEIDHRDCVRFNNRWTNLRLATGSLNQQNKRAAMKGNVCGVLGVTFRKKSGRFDARIRVNGKLRHIGAYDTAEEAHTAYVGSKRRLHPGGTL